MQTPNERNLNTPLLRKLSSTVNGHAATATFACGGSIPVPFASFGQGECGSQDIFPSVTIRWDDASSHLSYKSISFPLSEDDDASSDRLEDLLRACQPASFGVGGRDVVDENYRKAGKLDPEVFSTGFHPHDAGILDSVGQILLPSLVEGGVGVGIGPYGVRAELYKLNVYSAPSGRFRSHVDTPRGPMQFGSLVVCLPCSHEGGTLRVKHRDQIKDFKWANPDPQTIQWAAFYGDCEHEVLEVTEGHRVTLTYNLYYSSIGRLAQPVSTPLQLPLYNIVRDILQEPTFMSEGGILGFFCHHQYAHATESGRKSIPLAFKGVDLAVYSVFQCLGLSVGVHPIIENRSEKIGGLSAKDLMKPPTRSSGDHVEHCLASMVRKSDPKERENFDYDYRRGEHYEHREERTTVVGTKLHGPTFTELYEEEDTEPVMDVWPHKKVPQIVWMNEPVHKDFAYAAIAYGNQASINYQFSAASILVVVPASTERMLPPTPTMASKSAGTETDTPSSDDSIASSTPLGSDWSVAGETPAGSSALQTFLSGTTRSTDVMWGAEGISPSQYRW